MTGNEYCPRCTVYQPIKVYRPSWGVVFNCQVCNHSWRKPKGVRETGRERRDYVSP